MRTPKVYAVASLLVALALAPSVSSAEGKHDNRAAARALADEAQEAYRAKDYAAAVERFTRADTLFHAPTLLLGLARAEVALGDLGAARDVYARIVREGGAPGSPRVFFRAVEDARRELAALEDRVLSALVEAARATESRAAEKPAPLPPLAPGTSLRVTLGIVMSSAGGVGLTTGAVTGILALEREGHLAAVCPKNRCPQSAQSTVDSYTTLRVVGGSTLLAGASLAAAGVALILTAPRLLPRGAFVRPVIRPSYLGVEGAF